MSFLLVCLLASAENGARKMTTATPIVSFPSNVTLDELWEANLDDIIGPWLTRASFVHVQHPLEEPEPEPVVVGTDCVCVRLFSIADICSVVRSSSECL
jgi:hypothetical protein